MLSFNNVNLKLISGIEKHQFIESTLRGGISMICKGYTEGKNKPLKSCDVNKPTSYIKYLDANNLYGDSVMQKFDSVNPKEFSLDNCSNDSPIDSLLAVYLDYPDELHNLHDNHSLAGKKIKVTEEMLSKCQLQIIEDNNFSFGKIKKLILNLGNKRKYKLHYQNLKLYYN